MVQQLRGERWRERARRWWRSQARYTGLQFWTVSRGLYLLAAAGVFYLISARVIGWQLTYEIAVGLASPSTVPSPSAAVRGLAWVISVLGWLAVPGVAGAVTGYVVTVHADQRRDQPLDALLPPTPPTPPGDDAHG